MTLRAALTAAVLFATLTGCTFGTPAPAALTTPTPAAGAPITPLRDGATPATIATAPPSNHVTGTYPGHCHSDGHHPDPSCTPGAVRADITQASIRATICRPGWTATARPPESETATVKRAAMRAYGEPAAATATTELDHDIPLELGGANNTANLWPQPSDQPGHGYRNSKDDVENTLHQAVCAGRVPLSAAQQAIASDWTTARQHLGV